MGEPVRGALLALACGAIALAQIPVPNPFQGAGGSGGGASASLPFPISLVAGTITYTCSSGTPCGVQMSNTQFCTFTSNITLPAPTGSPTMRASISDGTDGNTICTFVVNYTTASGVTCTGCTLVPSSSAFGSGWQVNTWTATSGAWNASGTTLQGIGGSMPPVVCDSGCTSSGNNHLTVTGGAAIAPYWYMMGASGGVSGNGHINVGNTGVALKMTYWVVTVYVPLTLNHLTAYLLVGTGHNALGLTDSSANCVPLTGGTTATIAAPGTGAPTRFTFAAPLTLNPGTYFVWWTSDALGDQMYTIDDSLNTPEMGNSGLSSSTYLYFTGANAATAPANVITPPSTCGTRSAITGVRIPQITGS